MLGFRVLGFKVLEPRVLKGLGLSSKCVGMIFSFLANGIHFP